MVKPNTSSPGKQKEHMTLSNEFIDSLPTDAVEAILKQAQEVVVNGDTYVLKAKYEEQVRRSNACRLTLLEAKSAIRNRCDLFCLPTGKIETADTDLT